jgi:exopolysaccharide biosynthesis polyprenyl glycosylphosphotransferase
MKSAENTTTTDPPDLYEDLRAAVDERTHPRDAPRHPLPASQRRGWLMRRMLLAADLLGLSVAFVVTAGIFAASAEIDRVSIGTEFLLFFLTLPVWVLLMKLHGLYNRDEERADHSTADDLVGVFHVVTVGTWVFIVGAWLTDLANPSVPKMATFWALAILIVTTCRAAARTVCRRHPSYRQQTVIIGAEDVATLITRKFHQHPEYGINVVGTVDWRPREDGESELPQYGVPEIILAVEGLGVERVVLASLGDPSEEALDLVRSLRERDVQVDIVPRFFEIVGPNVEVHTVEGLALMGLPPIRLSRSALLLKRGLDLCVSSAALFLLAPVLAAIALAIRLDSPGPVFFRQTRMGTGDRAFRIYKFRTMAADAEERKGQVAHLNKHARKGGDPRMFKVPNDPRVTRVGRLLRRFSLDELPQLVNVLKGEMSLVGPRPLIPEEDGHVVDWGRQRLRLKPGITGLWQVLGRDEIPFGEMVRLDYLYVTEWSLFNDVKLMLRTLPVITRSRSSSNGLAAQE